jgi:FAD/FMN-containing dehydrogenase
MLIKIMETRKHNKLQLELTTYFQGEVYFDDMSRGIYSTDASNYQVEPVAVCVPKNEDDVKMAVKIANGNGISILPRGGGTSLAGQTVGASLVLDFSKYMNKILEVNPAEKWVRVQPGLVRDELNAAIVQHGLQFAPDPATGNRANIGGMIGANSSGTRSIIYGKTVDHVLEAKILLADGQVLQLKELSSDEYKNRMSGDKREAEIYRQFKQIIDSNRDEIEKRYPKVMRRVAGYNLDEFTHTDRWNLSKIIVGSEGTLATLLEAKLNLVPLPKYTSLCVAHFANLLEALRATQQILSFKPSAVEILDKTLLSLAKKSRTTSHLCGFLQGDPEAVLFIEFYGDSPEEIIQRPREMIAHLQNQKLGYAYPIFSDKNDQTNIWSVRKSGLGLLLGMRGDRKPVPFIEDTCVPVEVLPEYIDQVIKICESHKTEVILYAHASVGVLHVRPVLNLKFQEDIEKMKSISDQTFELVKKYGGSFSSEHGDGLQRSAYLEKFYGTQIYNAFKEVKKFSTHII